MEGIEEEESGEEEVLGSSLTMEKVAAAKQFIENHYRAQMKNIQERKERAFLMVESMNFVALLNAHDTLLAELQKLCDAISHAVDLTEFTSKMNDMKLFDSFLQEPVGADAEDPAQGKPQNGLEVLALCYRTVYSYSYFCRVNGRLQFQSDRLLHNLSKDDVLKIFNLSGDQVFYLWNTFLNFHRLAHTSSLPVLAVKHFLP
ncbi:protein FAM135B-like protein [Gossypium australe]|uniref:Protein FAM135B-like protein n=1 Tax=Gossypium australe TaxID=47621 RepID=A0A5B6W5P5_9ROSI|nr:protein FAM135B-like protein [Gossypium australe]